MRKSIIGSLVLSILHSILFFGQDLGISVLLFAIPSVFLLIEMLKRHNKVKNKKALYLAVPIILLSSTYLFFNNEFFNVVNMIVIPLLLGIMIVWATLDTFKIKTLLGKAINLIIGSLEFIPNAIKLIKQGLKPKNKGEKDSNKNKKLKQIGIGILCSIPLLLIILALLISADEVFASLFGQIADKIIYLFTSDTLVSLLCRILIIIAVMIYFVCIIYNIFYKESSYNSIKKTEKKFTLKIDGTIINTVLTIINLVYFVFSTVQFIYVFIYLFVNPESLASDFHFAEYARQGFFQLMIVSFINFAIILITNSNKQKENENNRYAKAMNVLMAVFTIIIAVSAFMRMNLYENEYGYTFLRLMVYVILLTEIVMIIPTIYYIVKGKINIFKSYFIIALTMYVVVNFINIDATIARKNVNRYISKSSEREIDFTYLKNNTGTDAIPEIVRLYNNVEDKNLKRKINNYLYNEYKSLKEDRTWQEFNISKTVAENTLSKMDLQYIYTKDKSYNKKVDIDSNMNI